MTAIKCCVFYPLAQLLVGAQLASNTKAEVARIGIHEAGRTSSAAMAVNEADSLGAHFPCLLNYFRETDIIGMVSVQVDLDVALLRDNAHYFSPSLNSACHEPAREVNLDESVNAAIADPICRLLG